MNTRLSLLVTAALASHSGQLLAAVTPTATAQISNFTITLQDLAPQDGISPSITFNDVWEQGTSWHTGFFISPATSIEGTVKYAEPVHNSANSITPGGWSEIIAGQTASASSTINSLTATVQGNLTEEALQLGQPSYIGLSASASIAPHRQFTLSANTAMSITGHYTLAALASPASIHNVTWAYFELSILDRDQGDVYQRVSDMVQSTSGGSPTNTRNAPFEIAFANPTSQQFVGSIRGFAGAQALIDTTVPEPGSIGLMLSGLTVAGLVVRRRRACRSTHTRPCRP